MSDILHVNVETLSDSLDRASKMMQSLTSGNEVEAYHGIGFKQVSNMLSLFTPKRWALVEALRSSGAMKINTLAKHLKRDYKNVHTDVSLLMEWGIIQKNEDGLIFVPYDEFVFDVKLSSRKAA